MAVADFVAEAFETDAAAGGARLARRPVLVPRAVVGRDRPRSCSATRPATTAARPARPCSRSAGRARSPTRWRPRSGRPAARSAAAREVVAITVARQPRHRRRARRPARRSRRPTVVSGLDPKRTLVDLVDPVTLGPSMRWRAGNYPDAGRRSRRSTSSLDRLPRFPAARRRRPAPPRPDPGRRRGIDAIERAFDAAKYGRMSDTPILEATIPSLVDPSLVDGAPDGTHVMSVARAVRAADAAATAPGTRAAAPSVRRPGVVGVLDGPRPGDRRRERHAPARCSRPLDLERDYGLTGGHPLHGEQTLDQCFLWRPFLGSGPLPAAGRRPLPVRLRRPSRRRDHGAPGRTRRARSWPT